jgi:hypothetical protein
MCLSHPRKLPVCRSAMSLRIKQLAAWAAASCRFGPLRGPLPHGRPTRLCRCPSARSGS